MYRQHKIFPTGRLVAGESLWQTVQTQRDPLAICSTATPADRSVSTLCTPPTSLAALVFEPPSASRCRMPSYGEHAIA